MDHESSSVGKEDDVPVCLSACLCLSICLSGWLSVCLSVYLSVCIRLGSLLNNSPQPLKDLSITVCVCVCTCVCMSDLSVCVDRV